MLPLFQQLTSLNTFVQTSEDTDRMDWFENIFVAVHDAFLDSLKTDFIELYQEWLDTPTGKAWQDDVKTAQYYPPRSHTNHKKKEKTYKEVQ
jgi:hypothetical protein